VDLPYLISAETLRPTPRLNRAGEQADTSPAAEVVDLWKSFGATPVLRGISLRLKTAEVAAIIGRSGGGKSTFLRCLNYLVEFDKGEIRVDGRAIARGADGHGSRLLISKSELRAVRARMPMVFQRFNLFQHLTALGNVVEPQRLVLGRSRQEAEHRAELALARVGLLPRLRHHPMHLSGGEQQRVGIARALAMDPKIILFDEPTSSLDPELVSEVLDIIRSLAAEGMTMAIVTHEMQFARQTASRIYFIDAGAICEEGTPSELFESPKQPATRAFIRAILKS
jgi:ABC-type histidine transport system ATPase subunit